MMPSVPPRSRQDNSRCGQAGVAGRVDEEFLPHIVTSVTRPVRDAKLSGTTCSTPARLHGSGVTKVEFLLTEQDHHVLIDGGISTSYGWIAKWNTTTVANGTYFVAKHRLRRQRIEQAQ